MDVECRNTATRRLARSIQVIDFATLADSLLAVLPPEQLAAAKGYLGRRGKTFATLLRAIGESYPFSQRLQARYRTANEAIVEEGIRLLANISVGE